LTVMGLDLLQFALEVEEAFGLRLPDEEWASLTTPGKLIDALVQKLPVATSDCDLAGRALERLRDALRPWVSLSPSAIRPDTLLSELLPAVDPGGVWQEVGKALGVPRWPTVGKASGWVRGRKVTCIDEAVDFLVANASRVLKEPGEGWTRRQIADVIRRKIRDNFGVTEYREDSRFHEDMNLD